MTGRTGADLTQNDPTKAIFTASGTSPAVLDWSKFDILAGKEMHFNGTGSTFFNLVSGSAGASTINGLLAGEGNVWVINPNGVAFGANAHVDVGGTFAAAAGNIANADALRNGTATAPTFSSFGGTVSSAASSKFEAEQVALLGKKVEAAGDFKGAKSMTIGAAGKMVVDTSVGGSITVTVSDFAMDATETGVELGDLELGDTLAGLSGGDLVATSDRGIEVKGEVTVGGSALLQNAEGKIHVKTGASLRSTSVTMVDEVSLYTANLGGSGKRGDIVIDGEVRADADYGFGTVNVVAGKGEGNGGSVTLNGTVAADYYAQLGTRTGDVTVNGSLESSVMSVVSTRNGKITVGKTGEIKSTGAYEVYDIPGYVALYSAMDEKSTGDVDVKGKLTAQGSFGEVFATAGYNVEDPTKAGGSGKVTIDGTVTANYGVSAYGESVTIANTKGIVLADVTATKGGVKVTTASGNIVVPVGCSVAASGKSGKVELYAADDYFATGSISVDGSISADAVFLGVGLECPYNALLGDYYPSSKYGQGDIQINAGASVSGASDVMVVTDSGDINIAAGAVVKTTAKDAKMSIVSAFGYYATGNLNVQGTITSAENGYIELGAAMGLASEGSISLAMGSVVSAGGSLALYTGCDSTYYNDSSSVDYYGLNGVGGSIRVNGSLSAGKDVSIYSTDGVSGNGTIDASKGDLKINGGLDKIQLKGRIAAKNAFFDTTTYSSFADNLRYAHEIEISNAENSFETVTANGASVSVDGKGNVQILDVNALVGRARLSWTGGDLAIAGGKGVKAAGNVLVFAGGKIHVGADQQVVAGDTLALMSGRDADAKGADVIVDGRVSSAGTATLLATKGSVKVGTGASKAEVTSDTTVYVSASASDGLGSPDVVIGANGIVSAESMVSIAAAEGNVSVEKGALVAATGAGGNVTIAAGTGVNATSVLRVDGTVEAMGKGSVVNVLAGTGTNAKGDVTLNGTIRSAGEASLLAGSSIQTGTSGDIVVNGSLEAGNRATVAAVNGNAEIAESGKVVQSGSDGTAYVVAGIGADSKGNVIIKGSVTSEHDVSLMAGLEEGSANLRFEGKGSVTAKDGAYAVVRNGNLTQEGASIAIENGYAEVKTLPAAFSGETVNIIVRNGSCGSGNAFVAVDGKTYAQVDGNLSLAAANGGNLKGGKGVGTKVTEYGTFTFGDPNGKSNIEAGGNLSVYTAGKIESSGILQSAGDMTVSASTFGDVSYLRAGGTLTVNNVGKPAYPQIAYFESVDGKEPNIVNQPNDVVIFVDGRLAGGNLKILNQFGANEAFMVSTPELKSTQGIFGNPIFLHSDLDVANPIEVGAIEHLLQEVPRVLLDPEFPPEADSRIDSVVVPERDSIRFGVSGVKGS